jgi:hypothetical protein
MEETILNLDNFDLLQENSLEEVRTIIILKDKLVRRKK